MSLLSRFNLQIAAASESTEDYFLAGHILSGGTNLMYGPYSVALANDGRVGYNVYGQGPNRQTTLGNVVYSGILNSDGTPQVDHQFYSFSGASGPDNRCGYNSCVFDSDGNFFGSGTYYDGGTNAVNHMRLHQFDSTGTLIDNNEKLIRYGSPPSAIPFTPASMTKDSSGNPVLGFAYRIVAASTPQYPAYAVFGNGLSVTSAGPSVYSQITESRNNTLTSGGTAMGDPGAIAVTDTKVALGGENLDRVVQFTRGATPSSDFEVNYRPTNSNQERLRAIHLDSSNNLYLGGDRYLNGAGTDAYTEHNKTGSIIKLSTTGSLLWAKEIYNSTYYGGITVKDVMVLDIKEDPTDGHVWVAFMDNGNGQYPDGLSNSSNARFCILKLDSSNGTRIGGTVLKSPGRAANAAAEINVAKNTVVFLNRWGAAASAFDDSLFVAKLPLDGTANGTYSENTYNTTYRIEDIGTQYFLTTSNTYSPSVNTAVNSGSVNTFSEFNSTTNQAETGSSYIVPLATPAGSGYFLTDYQQANNLQTQAYSITVDENDFIYTGNQCVSTSAYGGSVVKINPTNGTAVYSSQIQSQNADLWLKGIVANNNGIFLGGTWDDGSGNNRKVAFIKLDSSLNVQNKQTVQSTSASVSQLGNGLFTDGSNYFVPSHATGAGSDLGLAEGFNGGTGNWSYQRAPNVPYDTEFWGGAQVGTSTQWYVGARENTTTTYREGFVLSTQNNTASYISKAYTIANSGNVRFTDVDYVDSSAVYVGGFYYKTTSPAGGKTFVCRMDNSGNPTWTRTFDIISSNDAGQEGFVATDSSGNVYLCGNKSTQDGAWIVKMDSSGNKLWSTLLEHDNTFSQLTIVREIVVDSNDVPIVCGYTGGAFVTNATEVSGFVARLPADGSGTGSYGKWTYSTLSNTLLTDNFTDSSFSPTYGTRGGQNVDSPTGTPLQDILVPPQIKAEVS